jgi:hypothetical protein
MDELLERPSRSEGVAQQPKLLSKRARKPAGLRFKRHPLRGTDTNITGFTPVTSPSLLPGATRLPKHRRLHKASSDFRPASVAKPQETITEI